jgi:2-keto-4-pentenoate hydratase/2-oxohepta-3-ene-1,7-dioic acid hydratase in catechol pathway
VKLASFKVGGSIRVGRVEGDQVVDLSAHWPSMEVLLEAGAIDAARMAPGPSIALADVHLEPPVRRPQKFLAIAANYQSHIDEVLATMPGYVPPTSQRWFNKQVSSLNGPYDPILMPPEGSDLDYEVELAVIIGKRCRRVSQADAPGVIAGFCIQNDVSVRDWQKRSPTIMLGKSFDTHGPLGPWLVTPDEVGDPHALRLTTTVNGEVRQDGSTSEMIDNCYAQIAYLSTVFTLEPGDVLATGTPKGTGSSMRPPGLLKIGDVVRCEIERIGFLEATVQADPAPPYAP